MISKRVVIIGSDGQLGHDLMLAFGDKAIGLTHKDIEITDAGMVFSVLSKLKPDVVINTAAIVKSEWCETNKEACFEVNAYGAENVAKASEAVGAVSVFISSDYVFDGRKKSFSEGDTTAPLNVYGESKLAGEQLTQKANSRHYIIRTSWLFGVQVSHKGHDFPRLILNRAREKGQVSVVNDQFGSPTYAYDLALKIKQLIDMEVPYGTFHITNQGACSWYHFAEEVLKLFDVHTNLVPIRTEESGSKLRRPVFSVLENRRLKDLNIELLRGWQDALADYEVKVREQDK